MKWNEIRNEFPNQWVLFEAIDAYSRDGQRHIVDLAVIDSFEEWMEAVNMFKKTRKVNPLGEFYLFNTTREELKILEQDYLNLRGMN